MKHVARLVTLYMREHMYATVYAVISFNFPKFVRTYETCMHHDKSLLHTCIVPPLISLLLSYVTLIHYDFVSRELHHVVGIDGSTGWVPLPYFGESCIMQGIMNHPSITRMKYT